MKTKWSLICLLAGGLLPAVHAADINIDAEIRLGRALPPPPPDVVVIDNDGPHGPPPWSHGHWFRRSRGYYYYPEGNVYYRPADHMWFYLEGSTWRTGVRLPDYVRVDFNRGVPLTMQTDRPYLYHRQVVTYYPPRYFSHVRIKDRNDHRDWDRHGDHDRDHGPGRNDDRGHDKDHGKGHDRDHR